MGVRGSKTRFFLPQNTFFPLRTSKKNDFEEKNFFEIFDPDPPDPPPGWAAEAHFGP